MATASFNPTVIPPVTVWVQFDSTIENLKDELNTAFATPAMGDDIQVFESQNISGQAVVVIPTGYVVQIGLTDWVTVDPINRNYILVSSDVDMQGTVDGGYTPVL